MGNNDGVFINIGADGSAAINQLDATGAAFGRLRGQIDATGRSLGASSGLMNMMGAAGESAINPAYLDKVAESAGRMGNAFQHAGIYLFSRQLLDTVGLGQLAQHAFMAIDLAMSGLTSAFGLATATVAPFLLAVGAGITVFRELEIHSRKSTAELMKLKKAQEDDINVIQAYVDAGGTMSASLRAVRADLLENQRVEVQGIEKNNEALLAREKAMRAQLEQVATQKVVNNITGESQLAYGDQTAALKKLSQSIHTTTLDIEANKAGFATWQDEIKGATHDLKDYKQQVDALFGKDPGFSAWNKGQDDMINASRAWGQANDRATEQYDAAMTKMRADQLQYQLNLDKMRQADDKFRENNSVVFNVASSGFRGMASEFGKDMGEMVSQNKSFHDVTVNLWKDTEAQVIDMITQMAIKYAAFLALTGGLFGTTGVGSAAGANKFLGTGFLGHALGTDTVVDSATPFVAGEAGVPERVTVTPLYGLGGSSAAAASAGEAGGGGNATIVVNAPITINGVQDPHAIADEIGQQLARAIHGQGQLGLVMS